MKNGKPILISAPSGAGKTSLVAALIKELDRLTVSISHTTRLMRPGEIDGVNYHFISIDEFKEKIAAGDFLEYANVFDNYYGTSKTWLTEALAQGNDVILEIDWQGAAQVRKLFSDAISIFILPPSLEVLEERLIQRGQDDADTIKKRMQQAKAEMSHSNEYEYSIVNDDFETALEELKAIILNNR